MRNSDRCMLMIAYMDKLDRVIHYLVNANFGQWPEDAFDAACSILENAKAEIQRTA